MTTQEDEFDRLRDRIETLEDELGIDAGPDPEELTDKDEHGKTWFKIDHGDIVYYIPADACDPKCDGFTDGDVEYHYDYAVRVHNDNVEARTDRYTIADTGVESLSHRDVQRALEGVLN